MLRGPSARLRVYDRLVADRANEASPQHTAGGEGQS